MPRKKVLKYEQKPELTKKVSDEVKRVGVSAADGLAGDGYIYALPSIIVAKTRTLKRKLSDFERESVRLLKNHTAKVCAAYPGLKSVVFNTVETSDGKVLITSPFGLPGQQTVTGAITSSVEVRKHHQNAGTTAHKERDTYHVKVLAFDPAFATVENINRVSASLGMKFS